MAARGLTPSRCTTISAEQATEGWHLDSRGYVPHAVMEKRRPQSARPETPEAAQAVLPL
jgi:hypothetical protein